MPRLFPRHAILPAFFAAALALPAAAEDAHHPPADQAKPPATQPAQPRAAEPSAPGGMMSGNMMQMMHQMMSTMMMQNSGAMHRMRMMGMGDMGMMGQMQGRGPAVERVEGHIAYLKAELKITAAQGKAWDDYATALRVNAKQLNEVAAERAKAPATASPVERIALEEKTLAARLEIARRTKPALAALYAAFSDDQKKTFSQLAAPRMGMGMH